MSRLAFSRAAWALLVSLFVLLATISAQAAGGTIGKDTVVLETGSSSGITVRLAEDLASLVNDGTTRHLLPVVGRGGVDNIADLLQTPGIDMAILQMDTLDYARTQNLSPGLENSLSYIAKLNYVEFHLLAGQQVQSVAELAGKLVSVGPRLGNTAITAERLFGLLRVPATLIYDAPDVAVAKLRRGEIAAVAFAGGKPAPLLRLLPTQGLRLLAIPLTPEVAAAYVPTELTAADYPALIPLAAPVNTVAIATALFVRPVTSDSDEYRKLTNFVDLFFTKFQTLLAPGHHAKWGEVNLASEIPGWRRFPPAEDWLKHTRSVVPDQDLRSAFMRFLDQRAEALGTSPMSQAQKDRLFDKFRDWQTTQTK